MKTLSTLLLLCGLMVGQKLPDNLPQLKVAAAKKGLHWMIFCVPIDMPKDQTFMAFAEVPGHPWNAYVENGGKPGWYAYGASQREAAANLIAALKLPENAHPDHKPKEDPMKHKQCPPPLEGGPNP